MTALIQAKNLSRYYATHCAVEDVSLSLQKGQILGFLGPNGAGKTTTMRMLCGNLAPSSGQIFIHGCNLLQTPKSAKMFVGYLPDTPPLYQELTVHEYLDYCARLHRVVARTRNKVINKTIQRCNLNAVSHRLIASLSKGFQQRVGIAQAILHNPKVIVLDEPTTALDPIQIREVRLLIAELAQDHGIIISTHALSEVQQSCTHVKIINKGRLVFDDTIAELKQSMNTTSLFIATRKAIDHELLAELPHILNIETLATNRYRIHHQLINNPAESIAEMIIAYGWGLLELTPEKKSIEELFVTLTDNEGTIA